MAMGYQLNSVNPQVEEEIDEVLAVAENLCNIKGGYKIFDSNVLEKINHKLIIENQSLCVHPIVFRQIKKTESIAVFLCTLGNEITRKSRELINAGEPLKGYVYDTFGSIAVEAAMDLIQEELRMKSSLSGLKITNRYSPGYCGWNISEQEKIFSLLPDKFCGVELTDSCLMLPVKSVSGIIGIGKNVKYDSYTCNLCDMEKCLYKNLANSSYSNDFNTGR